MFLCLVVGKRKMCRPTSRSTAAALLFLCLVVAPASADDTLAKALEDAVLPQLRNLSATAGGKAWGFAFVDQNTSVAFCHGDTGSSSCDADRDM